MHEFTAVRAQCLPASADTQELNDLNAAGVRSCAAMHLCLEIQHSRGHPGTRAESAVQGTLPGYNWLTICSA